MPSLIASVLQQLNERDVVYAPPAPTQFIADYYVQTLTPKGSRARFQRRSFLQQLPGQAKSETAILAYLRKLHPNTEVTIINLQYK